MQTHAEDDLRTAVRARLDGRNSPSGGRTEAAADAAQVHCAARRQQGAHAARVADHVARPDVGVHQGGQLLGPRRAAAAAEQRARRAPGRTASACGGRRARAPRRGGSRRRRARGQPGPGGLQLLQPRAVVRQGPQNAVENWTTVRSASPGRTPRRVEARLRARPRRRRPAGGRRGPRRCACAATTPRRPVTTSAATSTAAPIPLIPRSNPTGPVAIPPAAVLSRRARRRSPRPRRARRRSAGSRWSAAARRAAPGCVAQVEQVAGPVTRNPGTSTPAPAAFCTSITQLVAREGHRAGRGQRNRLPEQLARSW